MAIRYPSHQPRKPFYRQKDPASRENYASELHQVRILRLSKVDRPDGRPWLRPLYALPKYFPPLFEKLREEQLVPEDLHRVLLTFRSVKYYRCQILYTSTDTFIVDFSNYKTYLLVVTEQGVERLPFYYTFVDGRKMYTSPPYTGAYTNHHLFDIPALIEFVGSALARLERSDHNGTRTIVLRFLKIITPVKCVIPLYDGCVYCPEEGELHRRNSNRYSDHHVWSMNIDKPSPMQRGLQLL
jgi:hypothetical protein